MLKKISLILLILIICIIFTLSVSAVPMSGTPQRHWTPFNGQIDKIELMPSTITLQVGQEATVTILPSPYTNLDILRSKKARECTDDFVATTYGVHLTELSLKSKLDFHVIKKNGFILQDTKTPMVLAKDQAHSTAGVIWLNNYYPPQEAYWYNTFNIKCENAGTDTFQLAAKWKRSDTYKCETDSSRSIGLSYLVPQKKLGSDSSLWDGEWIFKIKCKAGDTRPRIGPVGRAYSEFPDFSLFSILGIIAVLAIVILAWKREN